MAGEKRPGKIDYIVLAQALSFYEGHGFYYLEVPWTVSAEAINQTLPAGKKPDLFLGSKYLVGSAEQSFIEYMLQKKTLGKHCAITPCFRDDAEDEWHQKYFMKLELYQFIAKGTDPKIAERHLDRMITAAKEFFGRYISVRTQKTDDGIDIVCAASGVELGSYGIRYLKEGDGWVYGTGVAEPRFSAVKAMLVNENERLLKA